MREGQKKKKKKKEGRVEGVEWGEGKGDSRKTLPVSASRIYPTPEPLVNI